MLFVRRIGGSLRIVSNHHDGLLQVFVESGQNAQDLFPSLSIKISGRARPPGSNRIGNNGARYGDAAPASRELSRLVVMRSARPTNSR